MIRDVHQAVLVRYRELFPEWEIRMVAIYANMDREEQYQAIIQLLKEAKDYVIEAEKLPPYSKEEAMECKYPQLRLVKE